ncbi:hypothetical protein HaLaN_08424 [Haematococcus lacustris]|uniref:Uncharacterized protein n=1 Tax=Haematococcus lacustris TaxID=44745 RepID=A0A699ZB53_HAELA|nr:hypothetical protein HaLaN_08424 [Haematococcus lacustris]
MPSGLLPLSKTLPPPLLPPSQLPEGAGAPSMAQQAQAYAAYPAQAQYQPQQPQAQPPGALPGQQLPGGGLSAALVQELHHRDCWPIPAGLQLEMTQGGWAAAALPASPEAPLPPQACQKAQRWIDNIKLQLQHRAAASSAGTSLSISSGYTALVQFFKACRKVVERPNSGKT